MNLSDYTHLFSCNDNFIQNFGWRKKLTFISEQNHLFLIAISELNHLFLSEVSAKVILITC